MATIKLLVRIVIAFIWIYHLANCKVIKQRTGMDESINELNYGHSSVWLSKANSTDTSIFKHPNATSPSISRGFNSLTTHIPLDKRSFEKVRTFVHSAKRSLKKIWLAYGYYGPEIGLCSCLFKHAWFTYPVIPEVTYTVMGRARRMVDNFVQDFMHGFIMSYLERDKERINEKVSQTTADDYFDYQNQITDNYGPHRRIGHSQATDISENEQVIQKADPKLTALVEMLKNLQPKANQNDSFIIRYARALSHNGQNSRTVSVDDIRKFFGKYQHDAAKVNKTFSDAASLSSLNNKASAGKVDILEGRSSVASNIQYFPQNNNINNNVRRVLASGPPEGLPSFEDLPPADYNYYKNGVHHHVHDLRKKKSPPTGGGWLSFDFEDTILGVLGLSSHGKALAPTLKGCGKNYIFGVLLRCIQLLLFK